MSIKNIFKNLLHTLVISFLVINQAQAASETIYYHHDALGSIVASTDEDGQVKWREEYQPYGEKVYKTGEGDGEENQDWYTGKNYEPGLDISYFGARWYDAKQGRFLSIDPAPVDPTNIHTFNRYAYANNNPYKYVDPDGEFAIVAALVIAAAVFSVGNDTINAYNSNSSVTDTGISSTGAKAAGVAFAAGILSETNPLGKASKLLKGAKGLTDPKTIRFSQDSISGTFRDGRSVRDLAVGLKNGNIKPSDVPTIRTVQRNGQSVSIDNRRLAAFREAGVPIRTRPATASEITQAQKQGKFSAGASGTDTIRIRGE